MSLADLLFGADPPVDPDATAVVAGDDRRTHAQLRDQASALADRLAAAAVPPGAVVALMLDSGPDVVAALFGVWRAGAVYLPLNPRLTDGEVERILADVPPAAVVTSPDRVDRFPGSTVLVPATAPDGTFGWNAAAAAPVSDPATPVPPAAVGSHDQDVALIQFTSGTTGRPKAVLLRHSGVLDLLDGVLATLRGSRPRPTDPQPATEPQPATGPVEPRAPMPNLVPVSLSLWAGIYNVLFARRVGAPVIVLDPFTPAGFAEVVQRYDIRSTVLPPAAMTMLSDDPEVTDLAPLRFVRSITAPLSPLQARRFRDKFGVAILNCYGQTEIGGEIVGWSAADSRRWGDTKLGAVGRPHEGVVVRAVDPTGADLPADDAGELWVRTPALSAGYADGTDLGDRLTADGWFRTGDIGRVDVDGFVWIEGRVSEMINRGGLKVFPEEVAEVIRLAPGVVDVAVVGVPDERLGQVPWAFVVGSTGDGDGPDDVGAGDELDTEALDELCRRHLAPYKVPVRFERVPALPRNQIGKVVTADLVERARSKR